MAVSPKLWENINWYKICFQVITWNKKHSSEQVVSMLYIFEKNFFAAATFKGL